MRLGSTRVFFLLPIFTLVTAIIAWCAYAAWIFTHGWVPHAAFLGSLLLLWIGRPKVQTDPHSISPRNPTDWFVAVYIVVLGAIDPMQFVHRDRITGPWLVLLLAPLVFLGVIRLKRNSWIRAVGIWLALYGQYFALIYNITHTTSGIGCWSGWVY